MGKVLPFPVNDYVSRWEELKNRWIDYQSRLLFTIGSELMTEELLDYFELELSQLEAELEQMELERQGKRVQ